MKKCPTCGNAVLENDKSCDMCGYVFMSQQEKEEKLNDSMSKVKYQNYADGFQMEYLYAMLLGFFLPFVGFVAMIYWYMKVDKKSRYVLYGILASILVGSLFYMIMNGLASA